VTWAGIETDSSGELNLTTIDESGSVGMTVLMRLEDRQPFAYSRDEREFRRVGDDTAWARQIDGYLVSVRSGRPLAMQVGNFYLDAETLSLLYFAPSEARAAS